MHETPTTPDTPSTDELVALRAIVEGTARLTGQEFFQSLVRHLATGPTLEIGTDVLPPNASPPQVEDEIPEQPATLEATDPS